MAVYTTAEEALAALRKTEELLGAYDHALGRGTGTHDGGSQRRDL